MNPSSGLCRQVYDLRLGPSCRVDLLVTPAPARVCRTVCCDDWNNDGIRHAGTNEFVASTNCRFPVYLYLFSGEMAVGDPWTLPLLPRGTAVTSNWTVSGGCTFLHEESCHRIQRLVFVCLAFA